MQISNIRPGAKVEVHAVIIQKLAMKYFWRVSGEFGSQGIWETEEDVTNSVGEWFGSPVWVQETQTVEIEDSSGTCFLDLWGRDIGKFKVGDKIQLVNGYAKEVDGKIYLKRGKDGNLLKHES